MAGAGNQKMAVKNKNGVLKMTLAGLAALALALLAAWFLTARGKQKHETAQVPGVSDSPLYEAKDRPATLFLRGLDETTGRLVNFPWVIRLSQNRLNQLKQLILTYFKGSASGKTRTPMLAGLELNEIYWTPDNLVVVDVSTVRLKTEKTGYWEEMLFVRGLIETVARNFYEVRQVKILVDGREGSTLAGHYALGYSESAVSGK